MSFHYRVSRLITKFGSLLGSYVAKFVKFQSNLGIKQPNLQFLFAKSDEKMFFIRIFNDSLVMLVLDVATICCIL